MRFAEFFLEGKFWYGLPIMMFLILMAEIYGNHEPAKVKALKPVERIEFESVAEVETEPRIEIEERNIMISEEVSEPTYKAICLWNDYSLNEYEYDLLKKTVYCEAGNQDSDTQYMVALTILNRVASDKFPNTIYEVIYSDNQYKVTLWDNFESYSWTEQVSQAVDRALKENIHPTDMYYFRTKHFHEFGVPYFQSDDLWFSVERWEE